MSRTFAATIITEVDFVEDPGDAEQFDENFLRHLTEELEKAASNLSLRTIRGVRVTFCGGGALRPIA